MTFSSQLEARQFLIAKITNQASRTATALSDAEHRMLQLNLNQPASAAGIPVEMLEDKSGSYEEKMANLLRSAYDRDDKAPEEQQKYREALRTLQNSGHYMLIVATTAIPQQRRFGNYAVYVIIALAVAAMIFALQMWTRGK